MTRFPVSVVIATRDRADKLAKLFLSLREGEGRAAELVVVDASSDDRTRELCDRSRDCAGTLLCVRAPRPGAASQRNEGVSLAGQPFILFADDDAVLEPGCLRALWEALRSEPGLGGAGALITNQQYHRPGPVGRAFYTWLARDHAGDFAGRCIGPAVGFLMAEGAIRGDVSDVDWLPATCAMYRRESLPEPPFDPHFEGYSYGEDLALSLVVRRRWRLACAQRARAFHDRVKGEIKIGPLRFAEMELINRNFIMMRILGKDGADDYFRLLAYEFFMLASMWRTPLGRRQFPSALIGKLRALPRVIETAWCAGCY